MLGLQNYLTYGGEPFSFSTGNLFEQEKLFSLPGPDGSSTDVTMYYNSQDGRLSRVGAGWSFGLGARAQRFSDGSVLVVRADGASTAFTSDRHGGYRSAEAGVHQVLAEAGGGQLRLREVSGESWLFDASGKAVADLITSSCHGTAVLTRHAEDPVSREVRAGIAASYGPALTLGIGFNTWEGDAWGGEHPEQGGTQVYSRGGPADNAVSDSLVGTLPAYTGRPAANKGDNGNFPGAEFSGLPNAFTHLEALYLDNNYDRAFIDGGGMPHLADGVFTALGTYLETQGYDCTDPSLRVPPHPRARRPATPTTQAGTSSRRPTPPVRRRRTRTTASAAS